LKPGVGLLAPNSGTHRHRKGQRGAADRGDPLQGAASTDRQYGVNVYRWGDKRCIGLSGHVVGVDFPPEYADWRDVQPVELVTADVVKTPTQENIVRALKELAADASRVSIATDYDREGELIGKEAYELVREGPTRRSTASGSPR